MKSSNLDTRKSAENMFKMVAKKSAKNPALFKILGQVMKAFTGLLSFLYFLVFF